MFSCDWIYYNTMITNCIECTIKHLDMIIKWIKVSNEICHFNKIPKYDWIANDYKIDPLHYSVYFNILNDFDIKMSETLNPVLKNVNVKQWYIWHFY